MQPKVSVIIPVYKAEKYIERCALSLFNQTFESIEYIFIDDCSPDNSTKILHELMDKYKAYDKCKILRNVQNMGQSLSRKKGLDLAAGEYVLFVDSDDWLETNMISEMHKIAIEQHAEIVSIDFYEEWPNKQIIFKDKSKDFIDGILMETSAGSLWSKLIKKSIIDQNITWPKLNMGEDGALSIQLLLNCSKHVHLSKPLYHYYINYASTVNSQKKEDIHKRFMGLKESSDIIFNILDQHNLTLKYSRAILYRKIAIKLCLAPIINDKEYYQEFLNAYPEISLLTVFKSKTDLKIKMRYLLCDLRLFPYLKSCIKYLREAIIRPQNE